MLDFSRFLFLKFFLLFALFIDLFLLDRLSIIIFHRFLLNSESIQSKNVRDEQGFFSFSQLRRDILESYLFLHSLTENYV